MTFAARAVNDLLECGYCSHESSFALARRMCLLVDGVVISHTAKDAMVSQPSLGATKPFIMPGFAPRIPPTYAQYDIFIHDVSDSYPCFPIAYHTRNGAW